MGLFGCSVLLILVCQHERQQKQAVDTKPWSQCLISDPQLWSIEKRLVSVWHTWQLVVNFHFILNIKVKVWCQIVFDGLQLKLWQIEHISASLPRPPVCLDCNNQGAVVWFTCINILRFEEMHPLKLKIWPWDSEQKTSSAFGFFFILVCNLFCDE